MDNIKNKQRSILKKGLTVAGAALMLLGSLQPCTVNAAQTTTFTSDRPSGFYDTLFEVDKWGDLSVSVLRNSDVYRNVAFCMAKQKYFPTQDGVEYINNLDWSSWRWGRGDGTYVDQEIVRQVRNIMYAYNFELNHKLKDYGLEGDTMSLYSATSIALWAVIEGFTPDDLKIQPEVDQREREIAEKQLPLIKDLYNKRNVEGYKEGATLKNIETMKEAEHSIDITSEHVYQINDGDLYYRSPLMSLRPNQTDGVVFDGDGAYEYIVTLDGAPEGTLITDEKSNIISDGKFGYDLPQGSDFYVYVPLYAQDDDYKFSVKAETTQFKQMGLQLWTPTSSSGYQDILSNALIDDKGKAEIQISWNKEEKPEEKPQDPDKFYGGIEINKIASQPVSTTVEANNYGDLYVINWEDVPLKGAGFNFYFNNMITDANGNIHPKGGKVYAHEVKTSGSGKVVLSGLPMDQEKPTQYRVEEVSVPEGYKADEVNTIITVNPNKEGVIGKAEIRNNPITVNLNIRKTDSEGNSLEGAVFGLYNKEPIRVNDGNKIPANSLVAILTSDASGKLTLGDTKLPAGTDYTLKELKANDGYRVNPNAYDVIVDKATGATRVEFNGSPVEVITNEAIFKGSLEIAKIDTTDANKIHPMSNVEFVLYEDGNEINKGKTDVNGYLKFTGLKEGKSYTVKEITPDGYQEIEDLGPYTITSQNQKIEIEVENKRKVVESNGSIIINKKDATDSNNVEPMENVQFDLYLDGKLIQSATTNKEGIAMFKALEVDKTYTVKEILPEGYELREKIEPITLTKDQQTITITVNNYEIPEKLGSITIHKTDSETGQNMSDVKFTLYDDKGLVIKSKETNDRGLVSFINLELNKIYTIKETTPDGYQEAKPIDPIKLDENHIDVSLDIKNTPLDIRGNVKLIKVDEENGDKLKGAKFAIYNYSDKDYSDAIELKTTDNNGEVIFSNLKEGRYVIVEKEAPKGYRLDKTVINVDLRDIVNGATKTIEVENERLKTSIEIIKSDSKDDDIKVKGAKYALYTEDDEFIDDGITDKNGVIRFDELEFGRTYKIKETKAATNYKLDERTYKVSTNDTSKNVYKVHVEDDPILGEVKIIKVDSRNSDKKLEGARFAIYYRDDTDFSDPIAQVETNKDGVAVFKDLRVNDYAVKETRAPKDYKKSDSVYYVDEDDIEKGIIEIKVKNEPKTPDVPSEPNKEKPKDPNKPNKPQVNTGEVGMNVIIPAIAVSTGVVLLLYFGIIKKKEEDR